MEAFLHGFLSYSAAACRPASSHPWSAPRMSLVVSLLPTCVVAKVIDVKMLSDRAVLIFCANGDVESGGGFRSSAQRSASDFCTSLTKTLKEADSASKTSGSRTSLPLQRRRCRQQLKSSRAAAVHQMVSRSGSPFVRPWHAIGKARWVVWSAFIEGVARRSDRTRKVDESSERAEKPKGPRWPEADAPQAEAGLAAQDCGL